jgi:tRNA-specific 2-thiouridylase
MSKKIAVAMSGGVDSGVAAALLVKQGHRCTGFHLRLCQNNSGLEFAQKTAQKLGIPFLTIDFRGVFQKKVIDYFLQAYAVGLTPNPCVRCNQLIKFGKLWDLVQKQEFDFLATGHYARVRDQRLFQAKDKSKDQSYFLYNLTPQKLAKILFPVGDYSKKEVRLKAKEWRLSVARRPESQEICFLPESDYRPFLRGRVAEKIIPGEVVDTQGRKIGCHEGLPLYTLGQRHGFEVTDPKAIGPFYVIHKDIDNNILIVGFGRETEKKEFLVKEVNWINQPKVSRLKCQVKIRHQGELLDCQLIVQKTEGMVRVNLTEPERGIAPGQSAVFYQGEEVLGGGIINLDNQ